MFIAQVLLGPSEQVKQIIQIEHNIVKNPNWPEQTSWLFTSVTEDLNWEVERGQSGTRTQDRRIASLTR